MNVPLNTSTAAARRLAKSRLHILDEDDDDPVLSTINLIDVFLVVIGMLLIAVINNPMNPFADDKLTIIRNEGKPNMEIITKEGQKITRFKASGASGEGDGEKAGTAYRMKDGSMVYVPATASDTKR
jgi:hypothetical protein